MTTITISKTKPFTGKTLKEGQKVNIIVGNETFERTISKSGLAFFLSHRLETNGQPLRSFGLINANDWSATDKGNSFFGKCGVYMVSGNSWPEGSLTAQAKLLRALFKKPTAAELKAERIQAEKEAAKVVAEKRARDRKLKGLTLQARGLVHYFEANKDAFGCQRKHVLAICDILTGYPVGELVKS